MIIKVSLPNRFQLKTIPSFRTVPVSYTHLGAGLETDYPSFIRAVLEGVAFSQRHCLEVVLDRAARPDIIPLGGGAANSPLWCRCLLYTSRCV